MNQGQDHLAATFLPFPSLGSFSSLQHFWHSQCNSLRFRIYLCIRLKLYEFYSIFFSGKLSKDIKFHMCKLILTLCSFYQGSRIWPYWEWVFLSFFCLFLKGFFVNSLRIWYWQINTSLSERQVVFFLVWTKLFFVRK